MTLITFNLDFFHIPWISYKLRLSSNIFVGNHQFNVILLYFRQFSWQSLVPCHHLHYHFKYVDHFWDFFVIINFLALNIYIALMFMTFFANLILVYSYKSLSLKHVQGSRVVMSQFLLVPLNHLGRFSTLGIVTSVNPAHAAMRMVSSSYRKLLSSYVDHQTSYICFRDSPLSWWPMVSCWSLRC